MSFAALSFTASSGGTTAASGLGSFVDTTHNIWTVSGSGSMLKNGVVVSGSGVVLGLLWNNLIYYQDTQSNWWFNDLGTINWHLLPIGDPRGYGPIIAPMIFNFG